MQFHNLQQGSAEWRAHRARHLNASDAPAMMGCSPHMSRTELIRQLALGIEREFSDYVQRRVLDKGHTFEAHARPVAEQIMGEELAPIVATNGRFGASFDGQTMTGERSWEHKRLNAALREAMVEGCTGADLPMMYQVQMEHQAMVADGTEQVLFTASDWDDDGNLIEARHCWYTPNPQLRAQIVAGWDQLCEDVAAYVPPAVSTVEKIVAEPVEALPAPAVQVSGQIALIDNFKPFGQRLREFLDSKLIREPKTDEDFVNLDAQIKSMKAWREDLKGAKAQMLAQVEPIDQATKTADMLDKLLQQNCAMAESLLKDEKERRRGEIVAGGVAALQQHVTGLNARLGKPYMPLQAHSADFGGAIKGMRSLGSMEDAVSTLLAKSKIAANETFERVMANLTTLREKAANHAFLFADTAQLVLKAEDDLAAIVSSRISEHQAAEAKKEEEQRARIAAEEKAKAEAAAAADAKRLADEAAAKAREDERQRIAQEQAAAAAANAAKEAEDVKLRAQVIALERETQAGLAEAREAEPGLAPVFDALGDVARDLRADVVSSIDAGRAIAQARRAAAPVPVPLTQPTLKLGDIAERLGFALPAAFLKTLGFEPASKVGAHGVYHDAQFPAMCAALVAHVEAIQAKAAA